MVKRQHETMYRVVQENGNWHAYCNGVWRGKFPTVEKAIGFCRYWRDEIINNK